MLMRLGGEALPHTHTPTPRFPDSPGDIRPALSYSTLMANRTIEFKNPLEDFHAPKGLLYLPLLLVAAWFIWSGLYTVEAE